MCTHEFSNTCMILIIIFIIIKNTKKNFFSSKRVFFYNVIKSGKLFILFNKIVFEIATKSINLKLKMCLKLNYIKSKNLFLIMKF